MASRPQFCPSSVLAEGAGLVESAREVMDLDAKYMIRYHDIFAYLQSGSRCPFPEALLKRPAQSDDDDDDDETKNTLRFFGCDGLTQRLRRDSRFFRAKSVPTAVWRGRRWARPPPRGLPRLTAQRSVGRYNWRLFAFLRVRLRSLSFFALSVLCI